MRKTRWREEFLRHHVNLLPKREQLAWLEEYASSTDHFDYTPTTYYGDHDPFDVPISPCSQCGSELLRIWTPKKGRPSWRVVCSCGNKGPASDFPRKAVFRWNKSAKSHPVDYQNSPLFQLWGWSRGDAMERLSRIQNDLSLRIEVARLRREVFDDVSPGYVAKLVAYADWAQYLLDLIKKRPRQIEAEQKNLEEV